MTDLETIERVLDGWAFKHDTPLAIKRRREARQRAGEIVEALRREGRRIVEDRPQNLTDYSQFSFL